MFRRLSQFAPLILASGFACAQTNSGAANEPKPIRVNENCHILPGSDALPPRKKPLPYYDDAICSVGALKLSTHSEEKVEANLRQSLSVEVMEHTFELANPTSARIVFVVEQNVPQKWFIDSDPQPVSTTGQTALFRVYAEPGQRVELHVGMRRVYPGKSKPI